MFQGVAILPNPCKEFSSRHALQVLALVSIEFRFYSMYSSTGNQIYVDSLIDPVSWRTCVLVLLVFSFQLLLR